MSDLIPMHPDCEVRVRDVFGIDSPMTVPAFSQRTEHVPDVDSVYRFNPDVTLALLAGFARDRRVLVQGLHGTGKSSHIEQVAARLNWPCVRVNLDGHVSRLDLVGRDAVVLREGRQAGQALADDIVAFARLQLAGYKVPRELGFIDAVPRNVGGKVLKRELREGVHPYFAIHTK